MLHIIFIKCKVDVMYFIFIFISPSVPRFSVKKSVNQLIKNKRPNVHVPVKNLRTYSPDKSRADISPRLFQGYWATDYLPVA